MRVPVSLLKQYVDILEPMEALSERFMRLGLEVESVIVDRPAFSGVVVGRVVSVVPHPNAEKLRVAVVDDGVAEKTIVCGAANCVQGMTVALAQIGAKLGLRADGSCALEIKQASLRGIDSYGMLCSEEELGFADSSEGILALPDSMKTGQDLAQLCEETIFEVAVTPNLGHCLSIEGIAREIAASYGSSLKNPYEMGIVQGGSKDWSVVLPQSSLCSSYGALVIDHIGSVKTPFFMSQALRHMGQKPSTFVVDCANYVMFVSGQPLHVFDAKSFPDHRIVVEQASCEQRMTLIDNRSYTVPAGLLLITNGSTPLAVAGVMGDKESAFSEDTSKIVVEAAVFDSKAIRKGGKSLGLFSEAVRRFERGIDPNGWQRALQLFWHLISREMPEAVLEEVVRAGAQTVPPKGIVCRRSKVESILGQKFLPQVLEDVFSRLQYPYAWKDEDGLLVQVPAYRHDVSEEIDLVEDIAKLTNFAPPVLERGNTIVVTQMADHELYTQQSALRQLLVSLGLQEFVTCDLISPSNAEFLAVQNELICVQNPVSVDQSVLRPSLLSSLLDCVRRNIDHGMPSMGAFEVGTTYVRSTSSHSERSVVGVVLYGEAEPEHFSTEKREVDYFDIKGIFEAVVEHFSIKGCRTTPSSSPLFHDTRQGAIFCDSTQVGRLGEVHPVIAKKFGVEQRVYFMEIDLQEFLSFSRPRTSVTPLALFPSIERDWTITLDEAFPYQQLYDIVQKFAGKLVESIKVQSVFRSERLGIGKKNVTLHLVFRDQEKTLTSKVVDESFAKLIQEVSSTIGL